MSIYVTANFIKKRGIQNLFRFQDMLNEGKSLTEIGECFNVSAARVNVLRNKIFIRRYVLQTHVEKYLHCQIHIMEDNTSEVKKHLEKNVIEFHRR